MRRALVLLSLIAVAVAVPAAGTGSPSGARCFGKMETVLTLRGGNGNDVIVGTPGPDVIFGGGGNDLICSLGGDDRVDGGFGNDKVDLGPGNDLRIANAGNDMEWGGPGMDRLFGGPGDDTLFGGPDNDFLNGGPGMDRGFGEGGTDECILIEVIGTCEVGTPTGEKLTAQILNIIHFHPTGAVSSFTCVVFDGTDGATYVIVVSGGPVRGSIMTNGTFGPGPERYNFDIFTAGMLSIDLKATKGNETAGAMRTYDVPVPGPPANAGDSSCRK